MYLLKAVQELANKFAQLAHLVKTDKVETKTLCVGETCITEDQLKAFLQYSQTAPVSNYVPQVEAPVVNDEPEEVVIEEPAPEPVAEIPTPEPTPIEPQAETPAQ